MPDEKVTSYTKLISRTVARLERIWEQGEGDLAIEVRNDKGEKAAKLKGGETERIT